MRIFEVRGGLFRKKRRKGKTEDYLDALRATFFPARRLRSYLF